MDDAGGIPTSAGRPSAGMQNLSLTEMVLQPLFLEPVEESDKGRDQYDDSDPVADKAKNDRKGDLSEIPPGHCCLSMNNFPQFMFRLRKPPNRLPG